MTSDDPESEDDEWSEERFNRWEAKDRAFGLPIPSVNGGCLDDLECKGMPLGEWHKDSTWGGSETNLIWEHKCIWVWDKDGEI